MALPDFTKGDPHQKVSMIKT